MTLDEFVAKGWSDHATDAEGVFRRLPEGLALVTERRHMPPFAGLVVHVAGEHLGRWDEGLALLGSLESLPAWDPATPEGKSVMRSESVLHLCAGRTAEAARCEAAGRSGGGLPAASDRVRVLAIVASALTGQRRLEEASRHFEEALALAEYGPGKDDPAARALAVTSNNLAVELETRPTRTSAERDLMLRAAKAGRRWWEVAGGWTEVERSEYRLAMSHLKAGEAAAALAAARRCREIVVKNGDDPFEAFFAHEALARAHHALGDEAAARREGDGAAALLPKIEEDSRAYCEGESKKLDATLAGAPR
jgi:tetratricopeptide (TPR) repeat protein